MKKIIQFVQSHFRPDLFYMSSFSVFRVGLRDLPGMQILSPVCQLNQIVQFELSI